MDVSDGRLAQVAGLNNGLIFEAIGLETARGELIRGEANLSGSLRHLCLARCCMQGGTLNQDGLQ